MNVAVILAGGTGKRVGQDVPKQFLNVEDKPIMIYTLEAFDRHDIIDAILVTCIKGWEQIIQAYACDYGIKKLKWVVTGGEDVQASIENALEELKNHCAANDTIIIHDAVRPMIHYEIIEDCIRVCNEYGSGLSAVRCQETIIRSMDGIKGNEGIARSEIMRVQTPQAYPFYKVLWALDEAKKQGIKESVYINTLFIELGETMYFSLGSNKNIKITTMEDVDIFQGLYQSKRDGWIK